MKVINLIHLFKYNSIVRSNFWITVFYSLSEHFHALFFKIISPSSPSFSSNDLPFIIILLLSTLHLSFPICLFLIFMTHSFPMSAGLCLLQMPITHGLFSPSQIALKPVLEASQGQGRTAPWWMMEAGGT